MNDAGMRIRRIACSLLGSVLLLVVLPMPPAGAQQGSKVRLTLLSQTPWITPKSPTLTLQIRATNDGTAAYDRLSLGVTVATPATTQIDYTNSLTQLPSTVPPLYAQPFAETGSLQPGQSRTV